MIAEKQPPIVTLSGRPVIAGGRRQDIYEHPDDPTSVIKLPKLHTYDADGNLRERSPFDRFRRATAFRDFLREFREYIELKARYQQPGMKLPLCEIRGVVQTDLGLGLVYERIAEPDGALSPTLKLLIRSGTIGQQQLGELEDFFRILMEEHVVVSNMNLDNIVYQTGTDGRGRYVWIDSFGSKEFIPFRRWFKSRNNRKIRQIREKCVTRMMKALNAPAATIAD